MTGLPKITEKEFMRQVVQLARLRKWVVYHTHDSRFSAAGFPDLCMVRNGRLVFAELKAAGKKPTPEQQAWLQSLGAVPGVLAVCWTPESWADIERELA